MRLTNIDEAITPMTSVTTDESSTKTYFDAENMVVAISFPENVIEFLTYLAKFWQTVLMFPPPVFLLKHALCIRF